MLLLFTSVNNDVISFNTQTFINILKQDIPLKLSKLDEYLIDIKQEIVCKDTQNNIVVNLLNESINICNTEVYIFINTLTEGIILESENLELYINVVSNEKFVYKTTNARQPMQDNIKEIYVS